MDNQANLNCFSPVSVLKYYWQYKCYTYVIKAFQVFSQAEDELLKGLLFAEK